MLSRVPESGTGPTYALLVAVGAYKTVSAYHMPSEAASDVQCKGAFKCTSQMPIYPKAWGTPLPPSVFYDSPEQGITRKMPLTVTTRPPPAAVDCASLRPRGLSTSTWDALRVGLITSLAGCVVRHMQQSDVLCRREAGVGSCRLMQPAPPVTR